RSSPGTGESGSRRVTASCSPSRHEETRSQGVTLCRSQGGHVRTTAHPYMANSVPALKQEMLEAIGAASIEELFAQIPGSHRISGGLDLPPALVSEAELHRHLRETLARNQSCEENLSFLGAGCWQHFVPAVCDEIVRRSEFTTPVWGTP